MFETGGYLLTFLFATIKSKCSHRLNQYNSDFFILGDLYITNVTAFCCATQIRRSQVRLPILKYIRKEFLRGIQAYHIIQWN